MRKFLFIPSFFLITIFFVLISAQERKNEDSLDGLRKIHEEFLKKEKENISQMKSLLLKSETISKEGKETEIQAIKESLGKIITIAYDNMLELRKKELQFLENNRENVLNYFVNKISTNSFSTTLFYSELLGYKSDLYETLFGLRKSIIDEKLEDENKESVEEELD